MPPQHGAVAKHVAICALELLEYAQPALDRRAELETDAPGKRPAEWRTRLQHAARALNLEVDKSAPRVIAAPLHDMELGDAVAPHLVLRQVDTVLGEIDRHVLPEVDELQRRANIVRPADVLVARLLEQFQEQASNGVRGAAAVVEDLRGVGVAHLGDVLGEGGQQVRERTDRKVMPADRGRKLEEPRDVGVLPALYPAQLVAETLQLGEPDRCRRVTLVREVVGLSREAVNQRYRRAPAGGQKQGRDREIFVMGCGHLLLRNIYLESCYYVTSLTQLTNFRRACDYITIRKSRKWRNW